MFTPKLSWFGRSQRWLLPTVICIGAACAAAQPLSRIADPRDAPHPPPTPAIAHRDAALWTKAHAVFESRCVVCHGCYDAPCQLKADSFQGLERGANEKKIYDGSRLKAAEPSRLFIDAHLVSEWRHKGFHSVLPDALDSDAKHSVLERMLELKRAHPLNEAATDLDKSFTLGIDREQTCPTAKDFDAFATKHPLWGMPYALPGLTDAENSALLAWVDAGAPPPELTPLTAAQTKQIATWETFFNQTGNEHKLVARYIYEHLFLATLFFREIDSNTFFRLVRSRTPSGFPVDEIATRRPFEAPDVHEFYYRLVRIESARLAKTQMPYALDAARLTRYRELFEAPHYKVTQLPSYDLVVSANPLDAFAALPVESRYRFMLDEAQFTLMGFIKGPVCRGQVALNVIQERFWVLFVDPAAPFATREADLLRSVKPDLELPAEAGSNAWLSRWFEYAHEHADYVAKKNALYTEYARAKPGLGLDLVWDGEGHNPNAALTVFRHFDSASVVQGLVGGPPKTAWLIDYPMLERIHYLLVAGFDVFGNVGHQVLTRLYMDFLRMEGEASFLELLPRARRTELAHFWYRDVTKIAAHSIDLELAGTRAEPSLHYRTTRPELELYAALAQRIARVRSERWEFSTPDSIATSLRALSSLPPRAATLFPELSFLTITELDGSAHYFTLLRDSAHSNVASLFFENARRLPKEDSVRLVPGFLGAYPNALFSIPAADLPLFLREAAELTTQDSYRALREKFGVARNSPDFWRNSDAMNAAQRTLGADDSGLFDYNRLQAD